MTESEKIQKTVEKIQTKKNYRVQKNSWTVAEDTRLMRIILISEDVTLDRLADLVHAGFTNKRINGIRDRIHKLRAIWKQIDNISLDKN